MTMQQLYIVQDDGVTVDTHYPVDTEATQALAALRASLPPGWAATFTAPSSTAADPRAEARAAAVAALKAMGMSDDAIAALFLALA